MSYMHNNRGLASIAIAFSSLSQLFLLFIPVSNPARLLSLILTVLRHVASELDIRHTPNTLQHSAHHPREQRAMPYDSTASSFIHPDVLRGHFCSALSAMYRKEVPLYGDLVELVDEVNDEVRSRGGSWEVARESRPHIAHYHCFPLWLSP